MRRHRFALTFLPLVATILFIKPLVQREVLVLRDHFDYFQPLRWFTAVELRAGRLPLWNPWSASGEPWLANPQTGVFYPPTWLFVVLPFETAYILFLLLHLTILGVGAYLLFTRTMSRGGALVGATALMLSGPVMSLLDVSNNLATLSWIPLALWCAAEGAWRRGALVLALGFLGGEPFFAAVGAAMYAVIASWAPPLPVRSRMFRLALAGLAAFGLAAIQLLPFLEMVKGSDRVAGMDSKEVLLHAMPLRDWIRMVVPPRLDESALDPNLGQHFIPVIYIGIAVAILAVAGVVGTLSRRRETLGWIVLLIAAGVIASGPKLLAQLPLTLLRYPARLLPIAALALAALAAIGWDRFRPDRRWLDLLVVLVILADLAPRIRPLMRSAPFDPHPVPYASEIGARSKIVRAGEIDVLNRRDWIAGYLNLYDRRFDAFTAAPVVSARYLKRVREMTFSPTRERLASLGVGYILSRKRLPAPFTPIQRSASGVHVWRYDEALPMAAHFSPEPVIVRRVEWDLDTSAARIRVDAPRAGIVVLRQQAAPGWRVSVDGKRAGALLVDGVFRGVDVGPGRHLIAWSYHPRSLLVGIAITAFTFLAMQISLFVKRQASI